VDTKLFGSGKNEAHLVQQFMLMAANEFNPITAAWIMPILGYMPPNDAAIAKAKVDAKKTLAALNQVLFFNSRF
jgi:hypothetical protein